MFAVRPDDATMEAVYGLLEREGFEVVRAYLARLYGLRKAPPPRGRPGSRMEFSAWVESPRGRPSAAALAAAQDLLKENGFEAAWTYLRGLAVEGPVFIITPDRPDDATMEAAYGLLGRGGLRAVGAYLARLDVRRNAPPPQGGVQDPREALSVSGWLGAVQDYLMRIVRLRDPPPRDTAPFQEEILGWVEAARGRPGAAALAAARDLLKENGFEAAWAYFEWLSVEGPERPLR
jgi:hypothetical protein